MASKKTIEAQEQDAQVTTTADAKAEEQSAAQAKAEAAADAKAEKEAAAQAKAEAAAQAKAKKEAAAQVKAETDKMAFFEKKYPNDEVFYIASDGSVFRAHAKNYAERHQKTLDGKLTTYTAKK